MEGSYATHETNASPLTPNLKNLIKNVIQECAYPFVLFSFVFSFALNLHKLTLQKCKFSAKMGWEFTHSQ
jgi:hypothetical protein